MITVRPATLGDLSFLAETEKICFSDPWSERVIGEQLGSECGVSLIAERDGVPVGAFMGSLMLPEAEVSRVAVLPAYRKSGIGRALMAAFFDRWGDVAVCFLEVRASNAAAQALYRGCGFREIAVRRNYYTAPKEDALILKWEREHNIADPGI